MSISISGSGTTLTASGTVSVTVAVDSTTIGTVYTTGGAITEKQGTVFIYNSVPYQSWQNNHSYGLTDYVRDGYSQGWQCTTAGTSNNSGLAFPNGASIGQTKSDGSTVVWTCTGLTTFSMTLAAPTSGTDDGKLLRIMSLDPTSNAHLITVTGGSGFSTIQHSSTSTFSTSVNSGRGSNTLLLAFQGSWLLLDYPFYGIIS
jgi:hypothetical protein